MATPTAANMTRPAFRDEESRVQVIYHLLESEGEYLQNIRAVYVGFVTPALKDQKQGTYKLFNSKEHSHLVSLSKNIDRILHLNHLFELDMAAAILASFDGNAGKGSQPHIRIGEVCSRFASLFQSYKECAASLIEMTHKLEAEGSAAKAGNKDLIKLIEDTDTCLQAARGSTGSAHHWQRQPFTVQGLLLLPLGRLAFYCEMFEALLSLTDKRHDDYPHLQLACHAINDVIERVNDEEIRMAQLREVKQFRSEWVR
jgi:hypothetical protein